MKIRKVKIKKGKKNDITKSGYYSVFGNKDIAEFCRKIQSTTIRNGNELQDIILNDVTTQKLKKSIDLESLTRLVNSGESFYLANYKITKSELKKRGIDLEGKKSIDVDGIFCKDKILYILEYKQGDSLDTKKSHSEVESLCKISDFFKSYDIETSPKLVLWICDDLKNSSIKTNKHTDYLITGRDASEILGISFDNIENSRKLDQPDNIKFFFEEVERIRLTLS
jgi:hypothetical protein